MDFSDYRRGRKVRGPGTETSDSIPAMLSKNEFVIKAKSAKKIGFKALNHMNKTGEIPMRMKKSNPKQASDMGAMAGGGRMRIKGYVGGGSPGESTVELLKRRRSAIDDAEARAVAGESPNRPAPMPYKPETAQPPRVLSPAQPVPAAGTAPVKPKSFWGRFFAEGGGVMRCAACGGKMSSGGACMACGGKVAAGLRRAMGGKAHPGFKAVAAKIGKQPGVRNPGAVLAAASRGASPAAKRANPRLSRVKG